MITCSRINGRQHSNVSVFAGFTPHSWLPFHKALMLPCSRELTRSSAGITFILVYCSLLCKIFACATGAHYTCTVNFSLVLVTLWVHNGRAFVEYLGLWVSGFWQFVSFVLDKYGKRDPMTLNDRPSKNNSSSDRGLPINLGVQGCASGA